MIAVDTSSLARAFDMEMDRQAVLLRRMLSAKEAVFLPPIVITEIFSNQSLPDEAREEVLKMTPLSLHDGYWERAGLLRADLLRHGFKANLADCLIAQSCIDHDIALITYDRDFRHFVRAGLALA